jgi:hypothetical protein
LKKLLFEKGFLSQRGPPEDHRSSKAIVLQKPSFFKSHRSSKAIVLQKPSFFKNPPFSKTTVFQKPQLGPAPPPSAGLWGGFP